MSRSYTPSLPCSAIGMLWDCFTFTFSKTAMRTSDLSQRVVHMPLCHSVPVPSDTSVLLQNSWSTACVSCTPPRDHLRAIGRAAKWSHVNNITPGKDKLRGAIRRRTQLLLELGAGLCLYMTEARVPVIVQSFGV
jgi:hypothetical protein